MSRRQNIYFYVSNGDYIGKSSPFACYWPWSHAGFIFPSEATGLDNDCFLILDDEYNEGFSISTTHKRWWIGHPRASPSLRDFFCAQFRTQACNLFDKCTVNEFNFILNDYSI